MSHGLARRRALHPVRDGESHAEDAMAFGDTARTPPNNDKLSNNAMIVGTLAPICRVAGAAGHRQYAAMRCLQMSTRSFKQGKSRCREPGRKLHAKEFSGQPPT